MIIELGPPPPVVRPINQLAAECEQASPAALAAFVARLRHQFTQSRNPGLAALLGVAATIGRERGLTV
ncbi:hypothetical protein [Micromonospora sp. NPDC049645]|uniref:hypothetical protein n=1 Tax=Micromonospora sp. NPDC049645 TaxID=3155508 RepID=UPI003430D815